MFTKKKKKKKQFGCHKSSLHNLVLSHTKTNFGPILHVPKYTNKTCILKRYLSIVPGPYFRQYVFCMHIFRTENLSLSSIVLIHPFLWTNPNFSSYSTTIHSSSKVSIIPYPAYLPTLSIPYPTHNEYLTLPWVYLPNLLYPTTSRHICVTLTHPSLLLHTHTNLPYHDAEI